MFKGTMEKKKNSWKNNNVYKKKKKFNLYDKRYTNLYWNEKYNYSKWIRKNLKQCAVTTMTVVFINEYFFLILLNIIKWYSDKYPTLIHINQ